jgi:hypothetical protein
VTRRLVPAAVAALMVLGACHGNDSGDRTAYADSAYTGLASETPTAPKDDLRCIARAIVDGIGVDRLQSAGVTADELRNPEFEPPAMVAKSMDTAARIGLAARLQECDLGRIVGSDVALQFAGTKNPGSEIGRTDGSCFARGFDGPAAQRMIAGLMLSDLTIPDAERLARLAVECVGLGPMIANRFAVGLTDAEARCIDRTAPSDTTFVRTLAEQFRDVESTGESATSRLGASVATCLTPAHRRAVATS